jgi:peptide/nickel transport system permease protein
MSELNVSQELQDLDQPVKRKSPFAAILKRLAYSKLAITGLVILIVLIIVTILAPWIMPYGNNAIDAKNKFLKPSSEHLFGTDELGRDIFSRMLYGSRFSLLLAFSAVLISIVGGVVVGSIAGFFGGAVDQTIMRVTDVIQAIPGLLLNMALAVAFGPGFFNTILALGLSNIAHNARLMRSAVLKVRKMEYLDAATAVNCSNLRIISRHVLPNSFSPMIVSATMGVGHLILSAAALSYLGLGVQPPTPEWGAMLSAGRNYIMKYPHMTLIPGLCIMVVVLAINLFGDGLRDALDPRLKR